MYHESREEGGGGGGYINVNTLNLNKHILMYCIGKQLAHVCISQVSDWLIVPWIY